MVSVILPSYNHADFVEEAVMSVLDQDFKNLELIVVDDGSTDETPSKVSRVKDPRIKLISVGFANLKVFNCKPQLLHL